MRTSFLAPHREAVTADEHETPHLRNVRLCSIKRTDHGAVLIAAQVVGNITEPLEQLMVHGVSVPEEHLPDRNDGCLWFVH